MATSSHLAAAIAAQELRVRAADAQLGATLRGARARMTQRPSSFGGLFPRLATLAAGWLFLRRTRRPAAAVPATRSDRTMTLIQTALPLLTPVIGVRVAAMLGALATAARADATLDPDVAPRVDLDLFAGTWHEIARLPARGERHRTGPVTTTYEHVGAGLHVTHRYHRRSGRVATERGPLRVADRRSRARLKVSLAPAILRWLPFAWDDYWILDVSPDYERALVGTPDRRSLWILARQPVISEAEFRAIRLLAAAQGFDTQRLRLTTPGAVRPA